jgi:8-oxo-dGTP pyrophosphatase MutT (NUDIX family)/class 3 adenylate cyclase
VKPLVIAVDLVEYSLIQEATLRGHVRRFFHAIETTASDIIRAYEVEALMVPTGDGALLSWAFDDHHGPENARDIVVRLLGSLAEWMGSTGIGVRIGIHCDSAVRSMQVLGHPNCFGEGLNECVRVMGAADPRQALISRAAFDHLFSASQASLSLGPWFNVFDKHGIRHRVRPLGLPGTAWNLKTPRSATDFVVRVALGARAERDAVFAGVTRAKFVAMTYRTLGEVMASAKVAGRVVYPDLERAEMWVYAFPILVHCHPTLRDRELDLRREWTGGLRATIDGFFDRDRCPRLEQVDLYVISSEPTLTCSFLTRQDGDSTLRELRITHVVDGQESAAVPTIHLQAKDGEATPVFETYEAIVERIGRHRRPLRFPLKLTTGGQPYLRGEISAFIEALVSCCNNPHYASADRAFRARWRVSRTATGAEHSHAMDKLDVFAQIRSRPARLHARVDFNRDEVVLAIEDDICDSDVLTEIDGEHIVAAFVLMVTGNHRGIVLVDNPKPGWRYDVPGGKVSVLDGSMRDTVAREVFEELGLLVDQDRLGEPIAYKYDPMSAKERQQPVIAVYYPYRLSPAEELYLFGIAATGTKGLQGTGGPMAVIRYPSEHLLRQKRDNRRRGLEFEALCHAPLDAIEVIRTMFPDAAPASGSNTGCGEPRSQ